jgi:hypothetical protein
VRQANNRAGPHIPYNRAMIRMLAATLLSGALAATALAAETESRDHYVGVGSNDPAVIGQHLKLYVRERARPAVLKRGAGDKVVLFVHGAGTPAEVSFDVRSARRDADRSVIAPSEPAIYIVYGRCALETQPMIEPLRRESRYEAATICASGPKYVRGGFESPRRCCLIFLSVN